MPFPIDTEVNRPEFTGGVLHHNANAFVQAVGEHQCRVCLGPESNTDRKLSALFQDDRLIERVRNLVDYSVELDSFAGSDKETNPAFKEYHGLIYIRKLTALNALATHTPETFDLAFKLRRKRFVIEKLHLPPELQESEQRDQEDDISPMSCGSAKSHLLEF